jgi:hypothetical protein
MTTDVTPEPAVDHSAPCEHCGRSAPLNELYLCQRCSSRPRVVLLYAGRSNRPPGWPEHLKRLAERAGRGLPLFEDEAA